MLGIGAIDAVHDVIREDRLDLTVDGNLDHAGGGGWRISSRRRLRCIQSGKDEK